VRLPPFRKLVAPILLGAGILATFGREMAFAMGFGTGEELEIFRLAFGPPNMMSQTLAPAFVGVMLPLLAHAAKQGPEVERYLRHRILRINLWGAIAVAIVGALTAAPLAALLAPGYDAPRIAAIAAQLRILWLFFAITSLSFSCRSFLNLRGSFWPGASTSLAISSCFVAVCAFVNRGDLEATARTLSWAAVGGGALVLALHLLGRPLRREDRSFLRRDAIASGLSKMPVLMPLCGAAIYQVSAGIPRFLDRGFASSLPQGSVAALEYSYNVLTAPGILLGTSFVMLAYPAFVKGVAAGKPKLAARHAARPLSLVLAAAAAVSLAVFLFATPLVDLVYRRGAFDQADVQLTASVLTTQALGLMPMVAGMVLVQGLLGMQFIRLMLLVSIARIAFRWVALQLLVPAYGLPGIGVAYTLTEACILVVWAVLLWRRLNR